jgi:phosphotransferase family enzyme
VTSALQEPAVAPPVPLDAAEERGRVELVLRASAMREPLLQGLGLPPALPCHVLDAKYEPGRRCTVLYALGDRFVTGVLPLGPDGAPDGAAVVVGPGLQVWLFPDDPHLLELRAATDGGSLAAALGTEPPALVRTSLLRYRPGRRVTLAVDIRSPGSTARLVGKVYGDRAKAAAVHEESRALWQALGDGGPVAVPAPVAFLPQIPMVLWRRVPGVGLDQLLLGPSRLRQVEAAGRAVAALCALPPVTRRRRSAVTDLGRFQARLERVARVAPPLGDRLRSWADELNARVEALDDPAERPVHGDCKPSQLRVAPTGPWLLDFDNCGLGDPALDVGTFLASLRQRGQQGLERPFLEAYAGGAVPGELEHRVRWHQSVALLRKAMRAFARSPRSPVPAVLAAAGRACLDDA